MAQYNPQLVPFVASVNRSIELSDEVDEGRFPIWDVPDLGRKGVIELLK